MSDAPLLVRRFDRPTLAMAVAFVCGVAAVAHGQPATRDLSGFLGPNTTFTVTVSVTVPAGTQVAGYEDTPPEGWVVSNISNSGSVDVLTQSIKWGPYLEPSIPEFVSYDVTIPSALTGSTCFEGSVSLDGSDDPIEGDLCTPQSVPASSAWSLLAFVVLATAATIRKLKSRAKV